MTTLSALQSLIAQGESETLCSLLNGEGGKTRVGVGTKGGSSAKMSLASHSATSRRRSTAKNGPRASS